MPDPTPGALATVAAHRLTHRHVEVFRALMLAGSVTRAAELLHTSQPTVSRELARLERDRSGLPVRLCPHPQTGRRAVNATRSVRGPKLPACQTGNGEWPT